MSESCTVPWWWCIQVWVLELRSYLHDLIEKRQQIYLLTLLEMSYLYRGYPVVLSLAVGESWRAFVTCDCLILVVSWCQTSLIDIGVLSSIYLYACNESCQHCFQILASFSLLALFQFHTVLEHSLFGVCMSQVVEAWYSLEQYIGLKEDKLSSTTVDFIRSEWNLETKRLYWFSKPKMC